MNQQPSNIILLPCCKKPKSHPSTKQQWKFRLDDIQQVLEPIVTLVIGASALIGTVVFLLMCF